MSHQEELEVVSAWMLYATGPDWFSAPGLRQQLAGFLKSRHDVSGLDELAGRALRPSRKLHATTHAIKRFRERTGSKKRQGAIGRQLERMAEFAEEVELKPEMRLQTLLQHRGEDAVYLRASGWVLVVVGQRITTVHTGEAKRWQDKPGPD